MKFTAAQLAAARTLPKLFTLNVLASVTDECAGFGHGYVAVALASA